MKLRIQILALMVIQTLLLGGCLLFQSSETFYYLFEYTEPVPVSYQEPKVVGTLGVLEPEVSPVFERRQIVRRAQGPQLSFLSNDLWAVTPSAGVQSLLLERLRDSGIFESIEPERRDLEPRYLLAARLETLEYDNREERAAARVSITLSFLDARTGDTIARTEEEIARELSEATTYQFVVAVNEILGQEIDALIEEIDRWSAE